MPTAGSPAPAGPTTGSQAPVASTTRSRARSFGRIAEAYAAHRPGYPDAAIDWALAPLGTGPVQVLDLGAGTGKLTASLTARPGLSVVAVEPDPEMLARLRLDVPAATALEGSAEAIPLPAAAVDAVLVGQAFHWFDEARAMPEIARVLRPGGVLAGLWNADDGDVEWVAGYHEVASRDRPVPGIPQSGDRPELPGHPAFGRGERARFGHRMRLTADGLIELLGTHSWALVSEPADREATYTRIRDYLATRAEVTGAPGGVFELPLQTAVLRTLRR